MATSNRISAAQLGVDYAASYAAAQRAPRPKRRLRSAPAAEVLQGPFVRPGLLTRAERLRTLDGIERVMEGVYTHLPLKRARYGIDPVQRLRILRAQVLSLGDAFSDQAFHLELADCLARLRDAHTGYQGPFVLRDTSAVLPFQLEMYGRIDAPTYVITKVVRRVRGLAKGFQPGVIVESWNGVPIDRAVQRWSETQWGGRPDSQRVAGLQTLTMRPLRYGPPPDEHWVIIGYRAVDRHGRPKGPLREQRVAWRIVRPSSVPGARAAGRAAGGAPRGASALHRALSPAGEAVRHAKMLMFAPQALARQPAAGRRRDPLDSRLPDFMHATLVPLLTRKLPVLRIYSFNIDDDVAFVDELMRVLPMLPQDGLVIDIRDNPGGNIVAAERSLQLFTSNRIVPTRFSVLATPFTRAAASVPGMARDELSPWKESLEAAVRNGELYSQALPITDETACNDIGRVYRGPVLLVNNANTYSCGDLFSAGFVDNAIGPCICVGWATAGGGANVIDYDELFVALEGTPLALPRLPNGIGMSLSFRRATRSGSNLGLPIEDVGVGVKREDTYVMTRKDVLEGNRDLYAHCAARLFGPEG